VSGYRYHWHDGIEIQLILQGECELSIDGSLNYLVPNDLVLINAGCGHASLRRRDDCLSLVTHISPEYLYQLGLEPDKTRLTLNTQGDGLLRDSPLFDSLRAKLCLCLHSLKSGSPGASIAARGHIELFLAEVIDNFPLQSLDKSQQMKKEAYRDQILLPVIKYIGKNYRKKLTLEEVAEFAGYNRSYFSTFFKNALGIGFYEYLMRCRLQSAIAEMMNSDKSIADIALDNGFCNVKSFNQTFKHNFHKSPNEYRRSVRNKGPLLHRLDRIIAQDDNPIVCSYLERYLEESAVKQASNTMLEVTLRLRADEATARMLNQLAQSEVSIYLEGKSQSKI